MEHNLSSRSADEREEFGQLCCHSCLRDWWWVVLGLCFQRNSYHTLLLLTPICCCYSLSHVTPWTAAHQASLFITISLNLLKLMSIESIMPSNHRLLCRPLLLLPFTFPRIRVFSNESALCIRWPKYWSFSFSICSSNNIQGWFSWGLTVLISLQSKGLYSPGNDQLYWTLLVFLICGCSTDSWDFWCACERKWAQGLSALPCIHISFCIL